MGSRERKYLAFQKAHKNPAQLFKWMKSSIENMDGRKTKYWTLDTATGETYFSDHPISATITVEINR